MKKELKGSLTVEAALVMPVVLYTIAAIIVFLLFLYNRNVMTDAALLAARQISYYDKDSVNALLVRYAKEKCEEELCDRLIGMEDISIVVSVGRFQSTVTVKGRLTLAGTGIIGYSLPFETIQVQGRAERFYPGDVIRAIRKGEALTEWMKERTNKTDDSTIQEGFKPQLSDSSEGLQLLSD